MYVILILLDCCLILYNGVFQICVGIGVPLGKKTTLIFQINLSSNELEL